jgi:hypothetical protein
MGEVFGQIRMGQAGRLAYSVSFLILLAALLLSSPVQVYAQSVCPDGVVDPQSIFKNELNEFGTTYSHSYTRYYGTGWGRGNGEWCDEYTWVDPAGDYLIMTSTGQGDVGYIRYEQGVYLTQGEWYTASVYHSTYTPGVGYAQMLVHCGEEFLGCGTMVVNEVVPGSDAVLTGSGTTSVTFQAPFTAGYVYRLFAMNGQQIYIDDASLVRNSDGWQLLTNGGFSAESSKTLSRTLPDSWTLSPSYLYWIGIDVNGHLNLRSPAYNSGAVVYAQKPVSLRRGYYWLEFDYNSYVSRGDGNKGGIVEIPSLYWTLTGSGRKSGTVMIPADGTYNFRFSAEDGSELDIGYMMLQHYEECDDANIINGDGCSSTCGIEPCYECNGDPSVCRRSLGCSCTTGSACASGLCINGVCRAAGSCGSYDGYGCSTNGNAWNVDAGGTCLADGSCDYADPVMMDCGATGTSACQLGTDATYNACTTNSGNSCDSSAGGNFAQNGLCASGATNSCNTAGFVCLSGVTYYADESALASCAEGSQCDETLTDGDFSAGVKRYDPDDNYCDNCASYVGEDGDCEQACGASSQCDERDPGGWWCTNNVITAECAGTNSCVYSASGGGVGTCEVTDSYDTNCGGSVFCDEKLPSSTQTTCNGFGQTYFADTCSAACAAGDDTSICRSSAYGGTCTASASANGKAPNACDGTAGWIDSACAYYSDGDSNSNTCSCKADQTLGDSGKEWAIGGEVSAATCCGDDAGEWDRDSSYHASIESPPAASDACCDASTDCVHSNTCYASGTASVDVDGNGEVDYCSSHIWYDCSTDAQCNTASGYRCSSNNCINTCGQNSDCGSGFYCSQAGTCMAQKAQLGTCDYSVTFLDQSSESNGVCTSGLCRDDYDLASNADGDCDAGEECWCANAGNCIHNAVAYANTIAGPDCQNTGASSEDGTRWICGNGDWNTANCAAGSYCSNGANAICNVCTPADCAAYLSCRDGVNGGCCDAHGECSAADDDFCQIHTSDESAVNSPLGDGDLASGNVQMGTQYVCEPAKTLNRGAEASSTDSFNLNTKYTRQQTYMTSADWWQFSGDSPVTAQTSYQTTDTDLCLAYNYDPCTGSDGSIEYRNSAGTRGNLGTMDQGYVISAVGCSTNWFWINFGSGTYANTVGKNVLGAANGFMQVFMYSVGDYVREWQFGWRKGESGAVDGSNSYWCCDSVADCVDDAPLQGGGVSGDPDSTSSGCYNNKTLRDTGGGTGADTEYCRQGVWYAQDADEEACSAAGNQWIAGSGPNPNCCGDDAGEINTSSKYHISIDSPPAATLGCCTGATQCVHGVTCHNTGTNTFTVDGDIDFDYCDSGTWIDCHNSLDCSVPSQVCNVTSHDCIANDEGIGINELGKTGVDYSGSDCTSSRAVVLHLRYNPFHTRCRYANEVQAEWTPWEDCSNLRYWYLNATPGERLVYYEINHSDGISLIYNDTVDLDYSGACLDESAPNIPVVTDDGDYTNDKTRFHASWTPAYDPEAAQLGIDLTYEYQINGSSGSSKDRPRNWTDVGTQREITVPGLSLREGYNYSIFVRVKNSNNLTGISRSNGIIVDTVAPSINAISSPTHPTGNRWYSSDDVRLDWTVTDSTSGVSDYNYVLDKVQGNVISNITRGLGSKLTVTLSNQPDGRYYFHIKAKDKAGNWGPTVHYPSGGQYIGIDTTPPLEPKLVQDTKHATSTSTLFEWTESFDPDSGVVNYYLNVTDIDAKTSRIILINSTYPSYVLSTIVGHNYYVSVHAINGAGLNSSYVMADDITPPDIYFLKPERQIIRSPILVAMTDERAVCYYKLPEGQYRRFVYTNTTLHETDIELSQGVYTDVEVMCIDAVDLKSSEYISFDYSIDHAADTLLLTQPATYYVNQRIPIDMELGSSGVYLGELRRGDITLALDGTPLDISDFSLWDMSNGSYRLLIDDSIVTQPGEHTFRVTVRVGGSAAEDELTTTVNQLFHSVSYTDARYPAFDTDSLARITYSDAMSASIGLASMASDVSIASQPGILNLTADSDEDMYIFVSRGTKYLRQKDRELEREEFGEYLSSFGYPIDRDYHLRMVLDYNGIRFARQALLTEGKVKLHLLNQGENNGFVMVSPNVG